jgi:hypothetical protein
MLGHAQPVYL